MTGACVPAKPPEGVLALSIQLSKQRYATPGSNSGTNQAHTQQQQEEVVTHVA